MSLGRIEDVPMKCQLCGTVTRLGDCEPDVDGDGSLGCPLPDCGGIALEVSPSENCTPNAPPRSSPDRPS
jgi:hypothetical protein